VTIPEERLLVLYTDGVTEHERRPLSGEEELREAARSSYRRSTPPTDALIESLMALAEDTQDDASILTAWTPPQQQRRRPSRRLT
jgi:serine phosphatase RsbU (regulator of sigma subunit)